jgi:hypothetical protein
LFFKEIVASQFSLPPLIVTLVQQEVRAQAFNSGEDIMMSKAVTLTLKGGYDCDFIGNTSSGKTEIKSLTINNGTLVIDYIDISGP